MLPFGVLVCLKMVRSVRHCVWVIIFPDPFRSKCAQSGFSTCHASENNVSGTVQHIHIILTGFRLEGWLRSSRNQNHCRSASLLCLVSSEVVLAISHARPGAAIFTHIAGPSGIPLSQVSIDLTGVSACKLRVILAISVAHRQVHLPFLPNASFDLLL